MKIKLILLILLISAYVSAQKPSLPKHYTPLSINAHYGVQKPIGTLAQRFGINNRIGGGFEFISLPKGWIIGLDGYFIFGQKVKEDVLKNIRTPDGAIIGDIGTYAAVYMRERGYYIGIQSGKLFPFSDNGNRVSGLRLTISGGFLQHKILLKNDDNSAQQVAPPYAAGYDRLTNGFAIAQFIGYQIISRDKTLNLTLGFDFTEGFTQNRRGYNFDTRQRDDAKHIDLLTGIRATFSIPLFTNQKAEEIEY